MNIKITGFSKEVKPGCFRYSDIESEYGVNTLYFTKNGRPYTIISGELHFSRLPRERWSETILKMRECGVNTAATYVFWNYHNEKKGEFDFSGNRDIAAFLQLCKAVDMPCILRIGPWCHGEVIRGGFPKRIDAMPFKRTNNPKYLAEVAEYWRRLYKEISPFMDGKTVIAIQLENEYTGSTQHIKTLKRLAQDIGFKVPFFTMTAWPSGEADNELLPMMGGYPDAPWTPGKRPLKPNNRFAISPAKTENEIGADLHKNKLSHGGVYDDVPYAFCEIGPGNQVTQHRRPFISEKDGYGVGFAKFASGANWLGYYMFCGGANPAGRMMQENRLTFYPNNYPIIDYDFQAPISRYGECRGHAGRLRLMHLFINDFDSGICTKRAFFPKWASNDPNDISFLKCSVRADENASGYFFAGAYEKGFEYRDFKDVSVRFEIGGKSVSLPKIDVAAGAMFFYPFNIRLGSVLFDYILAQPVCKTQQNGKTVCWFAQCEGIEPKYSVNGAEHPLSFSEEGSAVGDVRIIVIPYEKAATFHFAQGRAFFSNGAVYCDGGRIFCEKESGEDIREKLALCECERQLLPYDYFLYSTGRRGYYRLVVPKDILKRFFDIRLEFDFDGLNLQVFCGKTLVNDYFNIDGKFVMYLRDFRKYIESSGEFIIRTAPKTKHGVSRVYSELPLPLHSNRLELKKAAVIERREIRL